MLMKYNAVDDYGVVLNTNHLHCIASKLFNPLAEKEWAENREAIVDDIIDRLPFVERVFSFTGEVYPVNDDGYTRYEAEPYVSDDLYYVGASWYPNLFKAVYRDMNEALDDIKSQVGKYLPDNFNYKDNFKHIIGVYYG